MYLVSESLGYDPASGRYVPMTVPKALTDAKYEVKGTAPWPGGTAWVVQGELHLEDVFLETGGQLVPVRLPSLDAGGLMGPDRMFGVLAADFDGDGTTEYLLDGFAGAHGNGYWVYHFEQERYRLLGYLFGDHGTTMQRGADGTYRFQTSDRDYDSRDLSARISKDYVWRNDGFVEVK